MLTTIDGDPDRPRRLTRLGCTSAKTLYKNCQDLKAAQPGLVAWIDDEWEDGEQREGLDWADFTMVATPPVLGHR